MALLPSTSSLDRRALRVRRAGIVLAVALVLDVLTLVPPQHGRTGPTAHVRTASAQEVAGPVAPSGVEAASGDRAVGLKWDHVASPDRAGYRIFRSTTLPVSTSGTPLNTSLVTGQTYIDSSRTNGTTYHYVVVTEDTAGRRSGPSATVSARPAAPAAPSGETITWSARTASEIARAEAGGAVVDGRLYVFGGQ